MTKKLFIFVATLCAVAQGVMAQDSEDILYVAPKDLPNAIYFLPTPPDTASYAFIDDMAQWQWGKTMRPTERGAQADRESLWQPDIMRTVMAEVLELDTISDEQTPALSRILFGRHEHRHYQGLLYAQKAFSPDERTAVGAV